MMTLKNIICTGFLLLWGTWSMAQNYAVSSIPDSLKENANAVIRYDYGHFEVFSPKKSKFTVKYVVTLLNDKTRENIISCYYDQYREVEKFTAKVYDANGKLVREYKNDDIRDVASFDGVSLYSDSRQKIIEVNYDKYPYTIEYSYERTNKGTRSYPPFTFGGFYRGLELSMFSLSIPEGMNFQYEMKNLELKPTIAQKKDSKKYTWLVKNQKAFVREAAMPAASEVLPILFASPDEIHVERYKGKTDSWAAFGKFMYDLNEGRDEVSNSMKGKIKTLTAKAKTDREKAKILYEYLQDNNRYVSVQLGIGGWQTFDAKYVEKNKYGDCKALSNFMMAMLKEVGVKAYTVLVEAGDDPVKVGEKFIRDPFNHVILYVPEEEVWLECTSKNNPFNYLGGFTEGRDVLLITEEGGKLVQTPPLTIEENRVINEATITLEPSGSAQLVNKEVCRGDEQDFHRRNFSNIAQADLEKWFHETYDFPSFQIEKLDLKIEKEKPEASLQYDLKIPRYASKAGKRLFVPINCINTFSNYLPEDKERQYRINIGTGLGSMHEDRIVIKVPEGYEVESIPKETITLDSEFGNYAVTIKVDGDQINYDRKLIFKSLDLPATKYEEVRSFYKAITKADKMKVVLVKKKT